MVVPDLKKQIVDNWPEFIEDLRSMIAIASVSGPSKPAAPFGLGPKQALEQVVKLGRAYGFEAGIINQAMAYVQWGPDDEHYIGIVGHLDVVAAGSGWTSPAFSLQERDGRYYGRGILDNKGPILACLYGLKLLKDAGVKLNQTIRLIFGSDEESGSRDVVLYLRQAQAPQLGFTPDCKFPVVYGERGIVNYEIQTPLPVADLAQFSAISGDQAKDHVPDALMMNILGQSLTGTGQRTPTNAPELGHNAILSLAQQITVQRLGPLTLQAYAQWLQRSFVDQYHGEGLGLDWSDQASGPLILAPYALQKTKMGLSLQLAIRYPVTISEDQITTQLQQVLLPKSTLQVIRRLPGILKDPQLPFIQSLSKIYGQVTGTQLAPVTTTGATYARVMPNIVAFGPSFPGQKGIAHRQDEWVAKADLQQMMMIYTQAILMLGQQKG